MLHESSLARGSNPDLLGQSFYIRLAHLLAGRFSGHDLLLEILTEALDAGEDGFGREIAQRAQAFALDLGRHILQQLSIMDDPEATRIILELLGEKP